MEVSRFLRFAVGLTAEPPEMIAGTLAYMAPEQTGRMNRSIDSRSDLYSLGVTFYEMLTGVLPFTASDPMEWVHCHIARQPVAPEQYAKEIPAPLSAIVMKLLAKTAEERYQTAAGVARDLWGCLTEWEEHYRIDPFQLGAHDVSDRLLIPEKLYGREREIDALLASFDRVVANGTPGAGARVRIFRYWQVLGGARVAQGARSATWSLCVRQVRPVQAGHPVRHTGPSLPELGASASGELAPSPAGGARPERPAHGRPRPRQILAAWESAIGNHSRLNHQRKCPPSDKVKIRCLIFKDLQS
jgi:hypothetical protein